ncbi:uncharacterized protein LOC132705008 [Cylas formicarius]|uniref:uncharacterized protein LOC132705008 n=1 Tax=Cylas formicarius TaxID=197179 RepID=UPI002958648A|nr:uncharacterized protein LOC132705008 [Cylas formicarius]
MRDVLKIFRLFLLSLTLACVCGDDLAKAETNPITIAYENNGKVNISSLEIVEAALEFVTTTQRLVPLYSPDVDETSGVADSGISTSGTAKQSSADDVSALGGKEILYSNVVNDEGTTTEDFPYDVRTEITVVEEVNGHTVRRKPTEQELKSLSHVVDDDDDVQDMSAILKLDPEFRKSNDEYDDDDNIEDMTSIFEENAETTTRGYTRKVVHIYKNTKEFTTFSNVSEGDPFEDDTTQKSIEFSTVNGDTTTQTGNDIDGSLVKEPTSTYQQDLTTSTTVNDVLTNTTSLDNQLTTTATPTTIRTHDFPTTNVDTTTAAASTTTEFATTEVHQVTEMSTSVMLEIQHKVTETPTTASLEQLTSMTTVSNEKTETSLPSTEKTMELSISNTSITTNESNETISTTIVTVIIDDTTKRSDNNSDAKETQPSLTSSEVESIYNTQLEQYDSDEEVAPENEGSSTHQPSTATTAKESIAEGSEPPVLTHRILTNQAVFSIKISKKDKTFYVPTHAVITQNNSAVTISWKGDGPVDNSVVLRIAEHDKYHVIKEIQLNIFRDGEMFNQRKLTAFTPAHSDDDSAQGKTRVVMMRDGTYVQFSNVDFLKKPEESEITEAAARSTRMWHLEIASICLTVVVLVSVTVYVVTVKAKQRHHSRKKVGEVLDTRC